ncbi:MAG TPA: hypothetical protein VFH31_12325 [Pyrinomonadaceae bacterium]|nr:hypothetical protein [Pyrinomonadaceae bacterium]
MALKRDPIAFPKLDDDQIAALGKFASLKSFEKGETLLQTSRPGIFAAADVRLGSTKRIASAVGERPMAVQFVHQYLASS